MRRSSPPANPADLVDLAVEAEDAAGAGIGDEADLAALPRLETGCRAGRDVEAAAARVLAVEQQRGVGFEKTVVRADLRIGRSPVLATVKVERRPAGVDFDVARLGGKLVRDHPDRPTVGAPFGREVIASEANSRAGSWSRGLRDCFVAMRLLAMLGGRPLTASMCQAGVDQRPATETVPMQVITIGLTSRSRFFRFTARMRAARSSFKSACGQAR